MGIFFPGIIEQIDLMSDTKGKDGNNKSFQTLRVIQEQLITISDILHEQRQGQSLGPK